MSAYARQAVHSNPISHITKLRSAAWNGVSINHCRLEPGELPEHTHPAFQVVVVLEANTWCEIATSDGRLKEGRPKSGSICILPSRNSHRISVDGPLEYLAIGLDPVVLTRAAAGCHIPFGGQIPAYALERDPVIWQVGQGYLKELESEHGNSSLFAESLANVLAVHLVRTYMVDRCAGHDQRGGLPGGSLVRVERFVDENLEKGPTVAEMAEHAGLSPYHFAREFKRATGVSPHRFVIEKRVERAKRLLADTDLPIVDVGLRVGFSSQSHFSRIFRRQTSLTPNAFRRAGAASNM